jgi:alpha-glucoside transport system substrate-binding protein
MRSKGYISIALLLLASVVLAACGSSGTTQAPTAAVTNAPVATAAPTAAAATAAAEPTTAATAAPAATSTTAGGALGDPKEAAMKAADGKQLGGSVSVLGTWGGSEQESFLAMVKPFEDATGTKVEYEGTRDLNAVLTTRVQGGNPPDLAGLPGPGQMAEFAKAGKLVDLSSVLDLTTLKREYAQSWIDLASYQGKPVGIFIKASLKGLI